MSACVWEREKEVDPITLSLSVLLLDYCGLDAITSLVTYLVITHESGETERIKKYAGGANGKL